MASHSITVTICTSHEHGNFIAVPCDRNGLLYTFYCMRGDWSSLGFFV
jgi:hypothetical protein